jgi:hypothetical protein
MPWTGGGLAAQEADAMMSTLMHPDPGAQIGQVLLRLQYQDLARRGEVFRKFQDVEFRCYSQNGEDGILLYIFSILGTTNRKVVEICAGDGIECNAANLLVNHGWSGLLFDGDAEQVARGRSFYSTCRNTWTAPPTFVNSWVTAEAVDALVANSGFSGPIDLLSLDLDGNDYWIWKALECVTPRVVVLEFNAGCGPDVSVTMSYRPDFRLDYAVQPYRCGASLAAFVKLARAKGYRLVGVQSRGFNAFFVRNGIGDSVLPERSTRDCYDDIELLRRVTPATAKVLLEGSTVWEDV